MLVLQSKMYIASPRAFASRHTRKFTTAIRNNGTKCENKGDRAGSLAAEQICGFEVSLDLFQGFKLVVPRTSITEGFSIIANI